MKKSLKDRFKKKTETTEETKTEIVEFNPTTTLAEEAVVVVVPPFDENG